MIKPFLATPGILGLAINAQHQFLMTQRNQPHDPEFHQKWQVPGGGMECDEQPKDTLIREMKEELNVEPELLFPYAICQTSVIKTSKNRISVPLMCFIITIGHQTVEIIDPETLDFAWLKREEIYRLKILPSTTYFIDEAIKICDKHDLWPQ